MLKMVPDLVVGYWNRWTSRVELAFIITTQVICF